MQAVNRTLAGFDHFRHYFAIEPFYTAGQTGPNVIVWLSNTRPIIMSNNQVLLGAGVRVEVISNRTTTTNINRSRTLNFGGGTVGWTTQDFVLSDANPATIGGVQVALPSSYILNQTRAAHASAYSNTLAALLLGVVLIACFWSLLAKK